MHRFNSPALGFAISGVPKVSSMISPSLGGTSFLYFHSGGPSKKPKS